MNTKLKFAGTIEEIRLLFQEMLKISIMQLKLAENEDFDQKTQEGLEAMLRERQSLMNRIDQAQDSAARCEEMLQSSQEEVGFLKPSGIYAGYVEQETEIRDIISLIQVNDRKCQALLTERMRSSEKKLGRARNNKKAFQYYNPVKPADHAWFFDRKK